jgi:protein phosphatase 1L
LISFAAIALSVDHKPNLKEEKQRVEEAGGMVVWAGTWRVCGILAVSRAFGDKPLKKFVIAKPYIQEETIERDDEFIIMASDGVWDVFSNEAAVELVREIASPEEAAVLLTKEAILRGSLDNLSCVVVRFSS